ncbi:hypothetical protein BUALT_Bualt12G0065500 [Buddleja alternifolia]|uniref:Glutamate receptor n=1 Tax=Buddleja alternifolia TaxID=168488 RepID=A0AAV6WVE6_9LAMI|nr:hypothetical protein BUALT_Bualt12G0065500 [Buddleja alternifolia]
MANLCLNWHAVLELLKYEKVHGILGPLGSPEESFFVEVGQTFHVPILSFTARSSALSYTEDSYFVRTTTDDATQAQALAAICQGFEWPEVVVLYEDTNNGNQFLSHLNKAFQEVEIGLAYMTPIQKSAGNDLLIKELDKIRTKKTKVFLVHMNRSLGYRLFNLAKRAGVMRDGYVWITTDSLSNFMNSVDFVTRDSMEGVLGIRPYVPRSKELESFEHRWKRNMIMKNNAGPIMELNVYGLQVYDAVTALAIAVEKIVPVNYTVHVVNTPENITDKTNSSVSTFGNRLLHELSNTKFRGLSGDFQLVDGRLKTSTFEIFNVIGTGEKVIGFWTQDKGITRELDSIGETTYSTSTKELKNVVWPGDSVTRPNGRAIPATGKLRVAVPDKRGFLEFLKVTFDPTTNHTSATGFSIDIFMATLKVLPFHIDLEFHKISIHSTTATNVSYHDIQEKIQDFDIIVADLTIWAPRLAYVDFSLPYSESNVALVVKNQKPFDMWIFIKPLRWELWLSFTANLSAILTVDQLKFAFSDNYNVGFQEGSFMHQFLTEELHISALRLKSYASVEEYHDAMSLGSKNGGIDAIFDEIPYLKLFMNKYQFQYKMVGPTYRTSGFGFAFPLGSPLVTYFSRAILNVTQSPEMNIFERKNFGPGYSSQDPLSSVISQGTSSLSLHEFAGLFLIVGSLTLLALFCSETSIGQKLTDMIGHFIQNRIRSKSPQVHAVEGTSVGEDSTIRDDGDESHEFTQDNAPQEGGDAQLIEEISEQEGEEIEIGMNDEVITAPEDG